MDARNFARAALARVSLVEKNETEFELCLDEAKATLSRSLDWIQEAIDGS